ncbi:MAG: hypothetical protein GKS07_10910 [Nitrosopumilus sp.]|nr:MAG: hypothetical protein GKS07_00475 [Nitrosopumilus sp.]QMU55351.1 MAG: hypothetical protein GKS07_10910 [Nitrosopumilus sp.]
MKLSKVFPVITFVVVIGSLGLSMFDIYEVGDTEIEFIMILVGTFGMGGLYKQAIKDGFSKFREIKEKTNVTDPI